MENKRKIAQVGTLGHYAYALASAQKYGLDFCGICAADPEDDLTRADRVIASYGFAPKHFSDISEMLTETEPDILIVNSVMGRNAELASIALLRGISVFCEKPVATTLKALERLEATYYGAKEQYSDRNLLFVGMFGIDYLPHFETAYRYIQSGNLGDIRLANAQKSYRMGNRERFYSDREKYGGTIPWVAIHAIEWVMRLGGLVPKAVTAYGSTAHNAGNGTMEASTLCLFACDGGRMASVSADVMRPATASTHDDDRLRLVGSKGILEVRGGRVFVIDGSGEHELSLVSCETELFEEMLLQMDHVGTLRVSAEHTFAATRAALLARLSQDEGRTVFFN